MSLAWTCLAARWVSWIRLDRVMGSFRLLLLGYPSPKFFPARSSKGVIGGSAGFHLVPEFGYRVVLSRQKKTRPSPGQAGS